MAADWLKIKKDCITNGLTQAELAKKYGVSERSIAEHSSREGWKKARKHVCRKASEKLQKKAEETAVNSAGELYDAARKLMGKAQQLLELEEALSPRDIKALTGAMLDVRILLGIRDEHDIIEQKMRIAKMQAELKEREQEDRQVEVVFVAPPWEGQQ